MSQFATADEVYGAIGAVFEEALAEPGLGDELAASGVVLLLEMTEPDSSITVDLPAKVVDCGPSDRQPNLRLKATADLAHHYWLGEVNVAVAIARGQIRVRGPVPTLIRLAGMVKPIFPRYRKRMGVEG